MKKYFLAGAAAAALAVFAVFQKTQHAAGFLPPQTVLLQGIVIAGILAGFKIPKGLRAKLSERLRGLNHHFHIITIIVTAAVFAVLAAVNRGILLSFMNSGDENSCYFMAQYLAAGQLWASPPPLQQFFEVTHVGILGGKWFSVYPPGWPLLWALGLKLHLKDLLNPLITAGSFYLWIRLGEKIYGRAAALLAVPLLALSPFFLLNGAAYYSHNLCLLLLLVFFYAIFKWRESSSAGWIAVAATALGFAAATRYLTAVAMAFPVLLWLLWILFRERSPRRFREAVLFAVIFAGLNGLHFYYNFLITGNFLNPPNHFLHAHEKLGFIPGYTPLTALQYLYERVLYLVDWTPPGLVILFLFKVIPDKIQGTWDGLLKAAVLFLPAGYFFYYSWGGNQYGPRYLFEAYPFLVMTFCGWLTAKCRRSPADAGLLAGLALAMIVGVVPLTAKHLAFYRQATAERKAVYIAAERKLEYPALVFLKGFLGKSRVMAQEDSARNAPFLDTPVIYAQDRGDENNKLAALFPGRKPYRIQYEATTGRAGVEELQV